MTIAQVYDALYARLQTVPFQYSTRNWVTASDLASKGRLPALEFAVGGWSNENAMNRAAVSRLDAVAVIYVKAQDNAEALAQLLALCAQVDAALRAKDGERGWHTTLGGICQHAWVEQVEIDEGDVAGFAAARVTIQVLAVI